MIVKKMEADKMKLPTSNVQIELTPLEAARLADILAFNVSVPESIGPRNSVKFKHAQDFMTKLFNELTTHRYYRNLADWSN